MPRPTQGEVQCTSLGPQHRQEEISYHMKEPLTDKCGWGRGAWHSWKLPAEAMSTALPFQALVLWTSTWRIKEDRRQVRKHREPMQTVLPERRGEAATAGEAEGPGLLLAPLCHMEQRALSRRGKTCTLSSPEHRRATVIWVVVGEIPKYCEPRVLISTNRGLQHWNRARKLQPTEKIGEILRISTCKFMHIEPT